MDPQCVKLPRARERSYIANYSAHGRKDSSVLVTSVLGHHPFLSLPTPFPYGIRGHTPSAFYRAAQIHAHSDEREQILPDVAVAAKFVKIFSFHRLRDGLDELVRLGRSS